MGGLLLGDSMSFALAFLLIMQLLLARIPPLPYWGIIALPVFGGGSMIYAALIADDACVFGQLCLKMNEVKMLYSIIGSSVIFLLLTVNFSRKDTVIAGNDLHKPHKFWMIMALTIMHLNLLLVDLATLAGLIGTDKSELASTVIRLAFVYLVLTSIFRVFDQVFQLDLSRIPTVTKIPERSDDPDKIKKIEQLLLEKKIYREMGLSREQLAQHVGTNEQTISRLINSHFKKSFTDLVNHYRVEEAKQRLLSEETAITVIAFEVGFNSIASFNRVFKEKVGSSPSEFRSAK